MSKKDTSYRPTPFALRKSDTEPMATRGGSSNAQTEEAEQPPEVAPEMELLLTETSVPDDVAAAIAKLPATADELTEADTVDILSVHELTQICKTFAIAITPVAEGIKGKNRRDRSIQVKTEMLALIASRFEDQWKVLHDEMKKRKAAPAKRTPRRTEAKANSTTMHGYQAGINNALMRVMRDDEMPSRSDFVFLNDEEYSAAQQFFRATHAETVSQKDESSGTEVCALQYLYGITKETTAALEACLSSAVATSSFIDKIVLAMEERQANAVVEVAQDVESSEDQGE